MGYELKINIGTLGKVQKKALIDIDGNYVKNEEDRFIYTDNNECWFYVFATVDLCKIYDSATYALAMKYQKSRKLIGEGNDVEYYYYDNNSSAIIEDACGSKWNPVPLKDVVKALRKDVKTDEYRRFKWAYELCKSMLKTDGEEKFVMFYGH